MRPRPIRDRRGVWCCRTFSPSTRHSALCLMDPAERPWLRSYDPGVPPEIEIPDEPLHVALSDAATRYPNRVAIRFYGRSVTYRELDLLANRFANALSGLGIGKGDRVALLMPN